ncbi:MAG TPA: hypothetical protein VFS20_08740 [Longimicrobium sp.]|nr:hypothetical protein [Longimicrobium sp.]
MREIFQGPAREPLDRTEIEGLRSSVIIDESRRRPLYFDGRFLAARDLVREQSYFLTRQADLGRAGGTGVVRGLMVERGEGTRTLRISAGHGLTAAGEPVMLPQDLVVRLDDLPQIQRLDLTLGLLAMPREPAYNRSGLYIVALRPVEYTSNPMASYPTSVDGQRGVEDGDIIEATVVTLIPYPDGGSGTADERRARAAYDIFVRGGKRGSPAPVLPLAMVQLDLNTVVWVDPFMVRREVAQERQDLLGIGFASRELRESHVLQYDHHLREVLRARGGLRQRFAAAEYFRALPPAGRMPAAAIASDFTQLWFPPTVEVDLAIVPADELPALLEESFLLPPIDLTRSADELDAVSVSVLIPVPRDRFASTAQSLQSLQRPLPPATPWMLARRQPIDVLRGLRLPATLVTPATTPAIDARWAEELNKVPVLWYARRRHLASRVDVTGVPVSLAALRDRLDEAAGNPPRITLGVRPPSGFDAQPEPSAPAPAPASDPSGTATGETTATTGTLGVRPPSGFDLQPDPSASEPSTSDETAAGDTTAASAGETTATASTRSVGELTLSPTVLNALRADLAASRPAPEDVEATAESAGTAASATGETAAATESTTAEDEAAKVDSGLVAPSGEPLRDAVEADAALASATPSEPAPALTSALAQAVIEAVRKEEEAGKEVPVASETLLSDPAFGSGLARLDEARPELAQDTRAVINLARSGVIQELDQLAATEPAAELANEVASLAGSRTRAAPTRLASAIRSRLPEGGAQ